MIKPNKTCWIDEYEWLHYADGTLFLDSAVVLRLFSLDLLQQWRAFSAARREINKTKSREKKKTSSAGHNDIIRYR